MFEGTVRLCLVVQQLLQTSQRMLDALDRPNRIHCVQVRGIRGTTPDEQLGHALVFLEEPESAASALAENLEAAKLTSRLHRLIVFPGEDREGQGFGSILSRSLARENTIADRHGEVRAFGAVPELDGAFDFCESLLCLGDVTRQVANLPSDVTLLVCMDRAQRVKLADFSVDLDFLDDGPDCRTRSLWLALARRWPSKGALRKKGEQMLWQETQVIEWIREAAPQAANEEIPLETVEGSFMFDEMAQWAWDYPDPGFQNR
jgi:hypothetical protein